MKHSLVFNTTPAPTTLQAVKTLNGSGGGGSANNVIGSSGAVTFLRIGSGATLTQVSTSVAGAGGGTIVQQTNGSGGGAGGSGTRNGVPVLFQRIPNNNLVQIRRIITQQPQQLCEITGGGGGNGNLSSSGSSVAGCDPTNGRRRGSGGKSFQNNGHEDDGDENVCLNDDSMGEVDVSIVDRGREHGEGEDDEDLLADREEDNNNGDGGGEEHRTAMEMNGEGVDSDYLRHVIETQILNRHKARIKDWDGTKAHMCQSCHEMFLSEKGLEAHRNRRIHHILFSCRSCKRDISFFNKCRLLQHLRHHRVTPTVSGLQNCTMIRLLPESEYLHFKYEDCTSSSDEENGGGSGGGSGGSGPPKRMKPSRFRRVARSSLSGTGFDSPDPSPPPARKDPGSSQPLSVRSAPSSESLGLTSTTTTSSNNTPTITIKYATGNANGNQLQVAGTGQQQQPPLRSSQVTVIKSTGNTTSVILPSSTAAKNINDTSPTPITPKQLTQSSINSNETQQNEPKIRIRSLSQITVSVNDEDEAEKDHLKPVQVVQQLQQRTQEPALKTVSAIKSETSERQSSPSVVVTNTPKEYKCWKCDRNFKSSQQFFKHLEDQEAAGFKSRSLHRCPTDDIPSWSQCKYVFHTKVFHEKSVPFMCPGCGDESPDYNSLMEHVTNNCFYLSLRVRYMCAAGSGDHKCSFADKKSVKTEPEIIDHLKKEHSRSVLQCIQCTQGFATENWLLKHLVDAHKINYDESMSESERDALINKSTRPLAQCLICNILFPNGPTYLQHVYLNFHVHILHAKMLECQTCFAVFETTEDIMNHRRQSEKCRKLSPSHLKISESTNEPVAESPPPQPTTTPAAIKITPNPAAVASKTYSNPNRAGPGQPQLVKQQFVQGRTLNSVRAPHPSTVAVISSNRVQSHISQQQQQPQRSPQKPYLNEPSKPKTSNEARATNSSQSVPLNSGIQHGSQSHVIRNAAKKNFFDDLQSCQFCERLVVFSSLRKHEDQCCGLSTVAPGFCLTCRQNFGDKRRLARHGVVHIKEGLPICLFCNNRNIRPTHPKSNNPSSQENLYALKKHLYSNHTSKAVQFPFQCPLCNKICNDKRATEFHIKDHQFKCTANDRDPSPLPTTQEDLRRLIKVRRKGFDPKKKSGKVIHVYYCPVCKNREFALEKGLARHLKLVHQKNPKSLNLSLLRKASSARRFVLKTPESSISGNNTASNPSLRSPTSPQRPHLRSGNLEIRTRSASSSSGITTRASTSNVTVTSSSSTTSFTSRFSSGTVLRKRLSSANSLLGKKPGGVPITQKSAPVTRLRASLDSPRQSRAPASNFLHRRPSAQPSKTVRKKDGTFVCLKCPDFVCKSENAFCEHIKWKHVWSEAEIQKLQYGNKAGLEERSEYWCPECNTKFIAKPSLVRHLKSIHDYISNVEDYMQKIGYDGKKPLKPNQCEVCYYQCEDDRELQQHIRTHGMAFLRLSQQRQMMAKT